jgi:hypothetical protein
LKKIQKGFFMTKSALLFNYYKSHVVGPLQNCNEVALLQWTDRRVNMSKYLFLIAIFSLNAFATVELCYRPAEIAFGLGNHHWLKTDTKSAGMGSNDPNVLNIGDQFEAPFITKVYVRDHSDQVEVACIEQEHIIESCVDEKLEIGKYLGRFTPINHCQTFVKSVLRACETDEYKLFRKEKKEFIRLLKRKRSVGRLVRKSRIRYENLIDKYNFTLD